MATTALAKALPVMLLATAMRLELAVAQGQLPPQCRSVVMSLAPCLGYLSGKEPSPPQPCCAQLGSAVNSQPGCLCALIAGGGAALGLKIDKERVLSLPETCKVQAPQVSECNSTAPATGGSQPAPVPSTPADKGDPAADASEPSTPASAGVSYGPNVNFVAFFLFAGVYCSVLAL